MTTQIALELRGRLQNLHATHTTSATSCLQQSSRWAALQASARAHDRPDHLFPSPYRTLRSVIESKQTRDPMAEHPKLPALSSSPGKVQCAGTNLRELQHALS